MTGGCGGVGFELCKILYGAGGSVYIAGRGQSKADAAISDIKLAHLISTGKIDFL